MPLLFIKHFLVRREDPVEQDGLDHRTCLFVSNPMGYQETGAETQYHLVNHTGCQYYPNTNITKDLISTANILRIINFIRVNRVQVPHPKNALNINIMAITSFYNAVICDLSNDLFPG